MPTKTRINGENYTQLPRIVSDDIILKGLPQTAGAPAGYGDLADAVNKTSGYISIKSFGAKGDGVDDTAAIDLMFSTLFVQGYQVGTLFTGAPKVYWPKGVYVYNGTGYAWSSGKAKSFYFAGDGQNQTFIQCNSDIFFMTFSDVDSMNVEQLTFVGGKGFAVSQTSGANVRQGVSFYRASFLDYTECAFGNNSSDFPFIFAEKCRFIGSAVTIPKFALAIGGLTDESNISDCEFWRYQYAIKIGRGGNNTKVFNNFFAGSTPSAAGLGSDIWVVPSVAEANSGSGLLLSSNKFGNELLPANVCRVLLAGEAAGTYFYSKIHATTESTGFVTGATVSDGNLFVGNSAINKGLFYSYTNKVNGWIFGENQITGTSPTFIFEFDAVVTAPGHSTDRFNLMEMPSSNTLNSAGTFFNVSNVPSQFYVIGEVQSAAGQKGAINNPASANDLSVAEIASISATTMSLASATGAAVTSPYGDTTAREVTFTSSSGSTNSGNLVSSMGTSGQYVGRTAWLEIDIKRGDTNSMERVNVWVKRNDSTSRREVSRCVQLQDYWQTVRIPFRFGQDGVAAAEAIRVVVDCVSCGFSAGVTEKVQINNPRLYISSGAVNYTHLQARGQNAGSWNGPRLILGAYHLWVDSTGDLRIKSGAPTSDTDGVVVGTQT